MVCPSNAHIIWLDKMHLAIKDREECQHHKFHWIRSAIESCQYETIFSSSSSVECNNATFLFFIHTFTLYWNHTRYKASNSLLIEFIIHHVIICRKGRSSDSSRDPNGKLWCHIAWASWRYLFISCCEP